MKRNSRNCWPVEIAGVLLGCAALLACGGCSEAWQRKFIRKKKTPDAKPNPIITFEDYSKMITPLDRYRKHFLMFQYWNEELLGALGDASPNPKRVGKASEESLAELREMQRLLQDEAVGRMQSIVDERASVDRQLRGLLSPSQVGLLVTQVDRQTRAIRRDWFWRDVEEQIKEAVPPAPPQRATADNP